ncbi:MAG: GMC family oxidoreductase, partial [Wenzhouxiangella sp.]
MAKTYDYIIVGAGSAGCVLAHRLSADPNCRVLLLEAGPRDWNPFIHMPAGLAKLVNFTSLNWNYQTEPEPQLNNRRLYWPRGRVLGGSSSINAMCFIRGHRSDYNDWAAAGNPGWSWDEVLPYFLRSQNQSRGASELHGIGGPLSVEDLSYFNPLSEVFIRSAEQAGFAVNRDFNGPTQRGFGLYQVTQRGGRRCSTAVGYLRPA